MMDVKLSALNDNLGIQVEGDLALQVIEESSNCEEDTDGESDIRPVSCVPADLVSSSTNPVYGSIQVTNSDHVHFGNNTYFHGNVVIKQIIHSKSGLENPSYTKTEDETTPDKDQHQKTLNLATKKLQIQCWHKVVFTAVCGVIMSGICAVILIINHNQEGSGNNSQSVSNQVDTLKCYINKLVVVAFPEKCVLIITTFTITSFLIYLATLIKNTFCSGSGMNSALKIVPFQHKLQEPLVVAQRFDNLLIAPDHLRIVNREDWLAQPVTGKLDELKLPAPWVIISHTATENCYSQSKCVLRVRLIQSFHVESRGWFDIGYNFLVGGDGSVYYGRGWDYIGAHTKGYNKYSIGIAFIGTFTTEDPPLQQVEACKKLIQLGVDSGKIAKDYKLLAHRQLMSTASPGDKIYEIIEKWPHFVKNDTPISQILPGY